MDKPVVKPASKRPSGPRKEGGPRSKPGARSERPSGRGGRGDKPRGDRPDRPSGDRKFDKPRGDRPDRPGGDRKFDKPRGDRPDRPSGDRKFDKPRGDRPSGDRKFDKLRGDRPDRPSGDRKFDKPRGDRPDRPGGDRKFDKPRGDRPDRPSGDRKFDKPRGDRPDRPGGDRKFDKPRGDRPPRGRGFESSGDRRNSRHGDSKPQEAIDPSRRYAVGQILRVIHDKKPLRDQGGPAWLALEPRDQAFAERLLKATLRNYGRLSRTVRRALTSAKLDDARLEPVMVTAACELIELDTPPYAVGSRYVDLVRDWGDGRYKGLVNAVIRRLADQGKQWYGQLGAEAALPRWLVSRWRRNWGEQVTDSWWPQFAAQSAVDLSLVHDVDEATINALTELGEFLPTGQIRLRADAGRVTALPGFEDGKFWVQDAAASLPVAMLGDVSGQSVFDLCAAPGGKTLQLANRGAAVTAVDADGQRLRRLHENLQRVPMSGVEVVEADVLRWQPKQRPDAILLDAPCSATGTLRHHPDAAWLRAEGDLGDNVELQAQMLERALDMLPIGGRLVYAVCSLECEEGEECH